MGKTMQSISFIMAVYTILFYDFGSGMELVLSPIKASTHVPVDLSLICVLPHSELMTIHGDIKSMSIRGKFGGILATIDYYDAKIKVYDQNIHAKGSRADGIFLAINITGHKVSSTVQYQCTLRVGRDAESVSSNKETLKANTSMEFAVTAAYQRLENVLDYLEQGYSREENRLVDVHKKLYDNVQFRARLRNHFYRNKPVIFDNVIINDGHHYNGRTGKFKAPTSGYYYFTLGCYVAADSWLILDLKTSSKVLTRIDGTAYEDWRNYVEGSVVAKLEEGDEVFPFVSESKRSKMSLQKRESKALLNHFSGNLIKAL